jgi:hypothetical protein
LLHSLLGQTGLGKSTYEHLALTHTPLAQQAPAGACPNNSEAETASPLKINFGEVVWFLSSKSKPWPEAENLNGVDFCEGGSITMKKPWDRQLAWHATLDHLFQVR